MTANQNDTSRGIRVALVEDQADQAAALLEVLRAAPGLVVVGHCLEADQAIADLPGQRPDVVLVDIGLPGRTGIELVAILREQLPQAKFLILTVIDRAEEVFAALAAGASGYLLKKNARERLGRAVQEVHEGEMPLSVPVARLVLAHFQERPVTPPPSSLTHREREVLDALAQGLTYKETGEKLGIALGTVQTHVERIYEKLHVRTRLEALRKTGRA